MKTLNKILLVVGSMVTTACSSGIETGGPCEYQLLEDMTKVATVTDSTVVLIGVEVYELPITRFKEKPALNDSYKVIAQHITQGSCSPISVQSVSKMSENASENVSLDVFKKKTKWPNNGQILKVLPMNSVSDRIVVNASQQLQEKTISTALMNDPHMGVLWLRKEKQNTFLSLSVIRGEKWETILNKMVGDYSPEYGGVSMLDNISIAPSPLGGYPDIAIFQTSLPAENDSNYMPGPPMEQVFYYDKEGGEYP